jgi:hypothetical protein
MTTFQNVWKEVSKTMTPGDGGRDGAAGDEGGSTSAKRSNAKNPGSRSDARSTATKRGAAARKGSQHSSGKKEQEEGDGNTTEVVAEKISEAVFSHHLAGEEKELSGKAVHYGFGTMIGGAYGIAAELLPPVTTGAGALYGAGVWLGVDETVLPVLGLSKGPTEYPVSIHAYGLAAHVVYGVTAEVVRRMVRHVL